MSEPVVELNLVRYLRVLWRRKSLVLAITASVCALFIFRSVSETKIFESEADVRLVNESLDTNTEVRVALWNFVRDPVLDELGPGVTRLDAMSPDETRILVLTARATSAELAQRAADLYAETYVGQNGDRAKAEIDRRLAEIDDLSADLALQLDDLDTQIETASSGLEEGQSSQELVSLRNQRDSIESRLVSLDAERDQLGLESALTTGGIEVISSADLNAEPISPRPRSDALAGFLIGLVLAAVIALLVDYLSDRVAGEADIENIAPHVPELGSVPEDPALDSSRTAALPTLHRPESPAAEAFRSIAARLQLLSTSGAPKSIVITSAVDGEGKSTVAANLAIALAATGRRVLLVGADLRRPVLERLFGLNSQKGLTDMLQGGVQLWQAITPVPVHSAAGRLDVLGVGHAGGSPSELFGSGEVSNMLGSASSYDLVLLDSPPVLPVADALVLGARADGVLLVCASGTTKRRHLRKALGMLESAAIPIVGVVLNRDSLPAAGSTYFISDAPASRDVRHRSLGSNDRP